jgi:hypothetical protein
MQLTDERLTDMALGALEEVAARCQDEPVPRSGALRLVLAYLASLKPCERHSFDAFWRAVAMERPRDRSANVQASLNGIYRQVGRKRETAVMRRYEAVARKRRMTGETR